MKGWMGKIKALLLISLATLLLSGCGKENLTALVPKGYGAEESLKLIILTTVVMSLVFLVVVIFFVIVLLRFRRKKGDEDFIPNQVEGNSLLETIWTIIPIILVVIMAVPTVISTFTLADDSDSGSHMNIDIIGNQYWWHFKYLNDETDDPEDEVKFETSQDLYVPVGEKIYLHLLSDDVIHSFWLPSISGKLDVNPENTNTMFIEAYEEGVFWGKCAELCGPSHSLMDFKVIVLSKEEYKQWEDDMLAVDPESEPEPTDPVVAEGKELFQNSCVACHAVDPQNVPSGGEGQEAPTGPTLTNFANRTAYAGYLDPTKENLVNWITDPEKYKSGNKMTDAVQNVSREEAEKIAEYLMQLEHSEISPKTVDEM